jgi:hypothetical protein
VKRGKLVGLVGFADAWIEKGAGCCGGSVGESEVGIEFAYADEGQRGASLPRRQESREVYDGIIAASTIGRCQASITCRRDACKMYGSTNEDPGTWVNGAQGRGAEGQTDI